MEPKVLRKGNRSFELGAAAVICAGIMFASPFAFAQPLPTGQNTPATKSAGDKRKTSIDFEDELIQGEVKKPELFYLLQKKQFNFKRLIKLREDFLPEMRRSSQDIRRSGSGN